MVEAASGAARGDPGLLGFEQAVNALLGLTDLVIGQPETSGDLFAGIASDEDFQGDLVERRGPVGVVMKNGDDERIGQPIGELNHAGLECARADAVLRGDLGGVAAPPEHLLEQTAVQFVQPDGSMQDGFGPLSRGVIGGSGNHGSTPISQDHFEQSFTRENVPSRFVHFSLNT